MTTKEYLSQAYLINQRINSKLEQVTMLKTLATKATSTLSNTPPSGTRNIHSMEDIIAKIIDLEMEINQDIDALVDLKRDITHAIKIINNSELQLLLELRYLCFKSWEKIAVDMEYSVQHIFRLHDKSLKEIVFQKDESKCD